MNDIERYGPQNDGDTSLTRRCRLLQSWYRVEVLGQSECGPFRVGGRRVGNVLVGGEETGANFLSQAAFEYAKEKVAEKASNPDLTIDEYRLFNNMLSSMPMCFNLFSDLRGGVLAGNPEATSVLCALFREAPIATVEYVEVEMIPRPTREYIDDKTAFDAAVLYRDESGRPGIVTIETKYTDKLGGNKASQEQRKFELAEALGLFTRDGLDWYRGNGFDQVTRNLLLTFAYAVRHGLAHASNYVLAPEQDDEAPRKVHALRKRLNTPFRGAIRFLALEDAVGRGLSAGLSEFGDLFKAFRRRYLDFSPVDALRSAALHQ